MLTRRVEANGGRKPENDGAITASVRTNLPTGTVLNFKGNLLQEADWMCMCVGIDELQTEMNSGAESAAAMQHQLRASGKRRKIWPVATLTSKPN